MSDAEVIVIGGGPAGAAAALHLARAGHDVLVVDAATFPREKVCGEGLMPHGVTELDRLGVDVAGLPFVGIGYHVGDAHAVGHFPSHPGRGLRRHRLDEALIGACRREQRVRLRLGERVRKVEADRHGARVLTDRGELRARALVGADGMHSHVRKQLGLQAPRRGRPRWGARAHFRLARGRPDRPVVDVYVHGHDRELYLTPTAPGEANVALLLEKSASKQLGGDLRGSFLQLARACPDVADFLDGAELVSDPKATGPLRQEATSRVTDGAVLVGDAAGFLDGITGEGMSLSLISARLAAGVLSSALRQRDLQRRRLREYERLYRRHARDLVMLTEIILWGIRHRRLARRVVRNLGRRPELFGRVLAINSGQAPLLSLGLRGVGRLLL